jgi:hypothetical protein
MSRRLVGGLVLGLGFCLVLSGCDRTNPSAKSEADKKQDEERALLSDPALAEPELERRLMAAVSVQGRVLIVRNPILGDITSSFLPVTTPWVINCGPGVSVVFGSSVNQGSNDADVDLSFATVEQKDCATIGPQLANRLLAILGDGARP